jgi:hypothetical protein
MKIYIEETTTLSLLMTLAKNDKNNTKINKILAKLESYLVKKQKIIDIYSKQGIYQVDDNQTYKLYVKSEKNHDNIILKTNDDKTITLVIDDSLIEKELTHQIPYEHINIPFIVHRYSLNKKENSDFVLVIEFVDNNDENATPINYYFEYNSKNINNNIPTENIIGFLSLVN